MTCIVTGFKTKKELKVRVAAINAGTDPVRHFYINDPSIFQANHSCTSDELQEGQEFVVTNHPKRSWFAQIGRKGGKLYVR